MLVLSFLTGLPVRSHFDSGLIVETLRSEKWNSEVSGSSNVLFDKLQLVMDTSRLDQDERTAKLRAEVEADVYAA